MAKRLLYLAVGALALTACTSSDVVDDVASTRNAISFNNVVNKHTRGVTDLTSQSLTNFSVFGFYTMPSNENHANRVFYNDSVSKNEGIWSYTVNTRYWVPDATYYFYAYSCDNAKKLSDTFGSFTLDMSNEGAGKPAAQRVLKINNYICDNTHQHDLVTASNTGIKVPLTGPMTNSQVDFQFEHILSKISAQFTSTFPSEYSVEIRNVKIGNLLNKGDYDFVAGWSGQVRTVGDPYVYLLNTNDGVEQFLEVSQVSGPKTTASAYAIPKIYDDNDGDAYIQFDIEVYFNEVVNTTVVKDLVVKKTLTANFRPNWAKGNAYLYTVELDGSAINMDKISFTVSAEVSNWIEDPGNTNAINKDNIK